jgi:iron complex outermembrane recepter protein
MSPHHPFPPHCWRSVLFLVFTFVLHSPGATQQIAPRDSTVALTPVVVTARRYPELAQRVPLSLTVLTAEAMQRGGGVSTLADVTLRSPNVNAFASRSSHGTAAVFIRGIGQEDNVFTVDPGVGIYLDDIYLPRAQGALLDILDVERVEVLRGPQGTLYGRNTIAGAIRYVSRPPARGFSADVDATTGSFRRRDLRAVVNLPISGQVLTRFSLGAFVEEGPERNVVTDEWLRSRNTLAARATVAVRPGEALSFVLRADGVRQRPSLHVGSLLRPQTTALDFAGLVAGQTTTIPVGEPFRVRANAQNRFDVDTWGVSGVLAWEPSPSLSVRSLTSYRTLAEDSRFDFDATEARAVDVFILHDHEQVSQELLLTRQGPQGQVVGGLYFFREQDGQFDGTDATAKGFSLDALYSQDVHSYAVFSHARLRLGGRLAVNGGARYTFEEKEFSRRAERHLANAQTGDENLFGGLGTGPGGSPPARFPGNGQQLTNIRGASADWGAWTPRLGLEYELARGGLLYASVARGFKSGGFNGRATEVANPQQRAPYDPEFVWTYELGAKGMAAGGRARASVAGFYNDYTDLQLSSFGAVDTNGDGVDDQFLPLFTNAARAVTTGFEVDAAGVPLRGLEVFGGVGYTFSEYREYVERGVDLSRSRELPNAPRWTGNAGVEASVPLRVLTLRLGAGAAYQGKRHLAVTNLPDLLQEAYTLLDAHATLLADRWRLTVGGHNLTDERYLVAGLDASSPPFGIVNGFYGDPRIWRITAAFAF